jgi:broad specificity phosphatase PhoE
MLFLARHGQSTANLGGLLAGRTDSPLTVLGRRQAASSGEALAAALAERPPGEGSLRLLSSPLVRARDTAGEIARCLRERLGEVAEVEVDARFVELDYGELDGTALAAVDPATWATWRSDPSWRPPGGETLLEVDERVRAACDELWPAAASGDVIVVSHVSPIKAAVTWALDIGVETTWRMSLGVASICRIGTSRGGGPGLVGFGETGHLSPLQG